MIENITYLRIDNFPQEGCIKTEFHEYGVNFKMVFMTPDGHKAWSGLLGKETIKNYCDYFEVSQEEYLEELNNVFYSKLGENFRFKMEDGKLEWFRRIDSDTETKYGHVYITPAPIDLVMEINHFLGKKYRQCNTTCLALSKQVEVLHQQNEYLTRINHDNESKTEQKERFLKMATAKLLSEKNEKIVHLQSELFEEREKYNALEQDLKKLKKS
uniref:XRCC4 N-terminal domain-containing protein n=1 Tax=Clastoptera arizonana TaxID=38151 RepID=A0A1B6CSY0_9HEMI